MVKARDRQVANRPIYAAVGVSLDGEKDILGLCAGTGALPAAQNCQFGHNRGSHPDRRAVDQIGGYSRSQPDQA